MSLARDPLNDCLAVRSKVWGGVDSNHRPADYESGEGQADYLRKFMSILIRAFACFS
jgi:hypothetical protein